MKGTARASLGPTQWVDRWQGLLQVLPEIAFIVLAAYLWYRTGEFREVGGNDLGPDFWPQLLATLLGVTAGVRLVRKVITLRRDRRSTAGSNPTQAPAGNPDAGVGIEVDEGDDEPISRGKAATAIALAIGYVLGVIYLGYPLAAAIFLLVFLWLAGQRNWLVIVPVSVGGAFVFTYMFQKIVFVALPTGVGFFDALTVWLYRLVGIY